MFVFVFRGGVGVGSLEPFETQRNKHYSSSRISIYKEKRDLHVSCIILSVFTTRGRRKKKKKKKGESFTNPLISKFAMFSASKV